MYVITHKLLIIFFGTHLVIVICLSLHVPTKAIEGQKKEKLERTHMHFH
jgi:hypothetical protein